MREPGLRARTLILAALFACAFTGLVGRLAYLQVLPCLQRSQPRRDASNGSEARERLRDEIGRDVPGIELEVQRLGKIQASTRADIFAVTNDGQEEGGKVLGKFRIKAQNGLQ